MLGLDTATSLDRLNYLSAGMVSFARGLNDTLKIAAMLLLAPAIGSFGSTAMVGAAIAIGGRYYLFADYDPEPGAPMMIYQGSS